MAYTSLNSYVLDIIGVTYNSQTNRRKMFVPCWIKSMAKFQTSEGTVT